MLTVTPEASKAIGMLITASRITDTGGLRVTMLDKPGDRSTITLSVANRPAEGDEVIECGVDARVFLEPHAATQLSKQVLDAHQDAEEAYRFSLHY